MPKTKKEKDQERLNKLRRNSPANFLMGESSVDEENLENSQEEEKGLMNEELPVNKGNTPDNTELEEGEKEKEEEPEKSQENEVSSQESEVSSQENVEDKPKVPSATIEATDDSISTSNIEESKKKRLARLKSKSKKSKVEDTHTRKTYLVRNDLLERVDAISTRHGFKIEFINFAIELALAEYEQIDEDE